MAEEKKKKDPTLYSDSYSYRTSWLWTDVKDEDDIGYPNIISFFVPSKGTPVSGKEYTPPAPDFKCECDIKECFVKIKEKMATKGGQPRATMLKLKDYEVQAWSQLLDYLRFEWGVLDNRGKVLLTGSEWYMLFGDNKKKSTKKSK